ncbi:hypothetical protein B484DRAFT_448044 [Ochromonadaceae sp. CCMP2298]|nr:hypothetical protein B484DRAFT_448044 [Ochromonadaceae sp. CCMP2298]
MGNATIFHKQDPNIVYVDEKSILDPLVQGVARGIFKKFEWETLKLFSQKYRIVQADINVVFRRFLIYPEVYMLGFQVRANDVKGKFLMGTKLIVELADAMVPMYLLKDFTGLEPAQSREEVTFARFCILSYLFCAQQMPDLLHDFVTILREKTKLSVQATMSAYSLDQLVPLLMEDLLPSAAGAVVKEASSRMGKEAELTILTMVKLGVKYPIMFYSVQRFVKLLKRQVFGDKFWEGRPALKLKIEDAEEEGLKNMNARFRDELSARRETSKSIICDAVAMRGYVFALTEDAAEEVVEVDAHVMAVLKGVFGYERSRQLVLDSDIFYEDSLLLQTALGAEEPVKRPLGGMGVFAEEGRGDRGTGILSLGESQVVLDPLTDRTFAFDAATGKSSWIVGVVDEGGEVAMELLY